MNETTVAAAVADPASPAIDPETALDYDDIVCKDLDEKMLRRVFRGLCGA